MGAQIAQLFSQVGKYPVMLVDIKDEFVNRGLQFIQGGLKKFFVDKGKMSQSDMDEIVGRIKGTTNLAEAAKGADFVVEAVFENLDVKRDIFKQLDENASPDIVLASNSSYLNTTDIGSLAKKRDRIVGMHFFNPVGVMKLVEVIRGPLSSDEAVDTTVAMGKRLGKEPVICKDFSYGFLANRLSLPVIDEALQMLWERVASPEDIDKAAKLGYNWPMGPLELGDYTGAWALFASGEQDRVKALGERGRLHPLLKMMIRAGYLGGPRGKGVYDFYKDVLSKG
jgi:3-hydroxybutyryl-CoA dehydrogenase